MDEWTQEVNGMPKPERRTAKGKAAVATCKQCARYLDPLFKQCKKKVWIIEVSRSSNSLNDLMLIANVWLDEFIGLLTHLISCFNLNC